MTEAQHATISDLEHFITQRGLWPEMGTEKAQKWKAYFQECARDGFIYVFMLVMERSSYHSGMIEEIRNLYPDPDNTVRISPQELGFDRLVVFRTIDDAVLAKLQGHVIPRPHLQKWVQSGKPELKGRF